MNAYTLCLAAVLSAPGSADEDRQPIYEPSQELAAAVRGQSPVYDENPAGEQILPAPGPGTGLFGAPPMTYDPFLGQPPVVGPYPAVPQGYSFGTSGPQPYRFGWTSRYDMAFMPKAATNGPGNFGHMGIFEFNSEWEYTTPLTADPAGWIFSSTPQFGLRSWDGPPTNTFPGLPGSVFRFGWDLELATPAVGAWSVQLGFNPAIASDFSRSLTSKAWNLDGRGILFYRYSPELMLALGAAYWDRVHDRVIPYAGAVWTPGDRWEFRLLFPQSRISYFLCNHDGFAKWLYVSGEYHVEAYEIALEPAGGREQIELEDWRLMFGMRMEQWGVAMFVEGGWVFGRDVEFANGAPGFDITSGFLGRIGLRF